MALSSKSQLRARRREQIVDAAASIVSQRGIENLSLSEIEKRTGLCRGQLTYYFRNKQDILLALYDRAIDLMEQRALIESPDLARSQPDPIQAARRMEQVLELVLRPEHWINSDIHALQHTFQAQIFHRPEVREKLAELYSKWRECIQKDLEALVSLRSIRPGNADTPEDGLKPTRQEIATVYQAMLHGLGMQVAADAACVEPTRMVKICQSVVEELIRRSGPSSQPASSPCS